MDAQAVPRRVTYARRWRHALEDRRVLAPLLIAPAVIYILLVVGVPFGWAIYLSMTDAIGGSLTGSWVGFDNFTNAWSDDHFQKALRNTLIFTFVSQAIVLVVAAVLSHYLVRDFPRQVVHPVPDHPAVGRSGRLGHDQLALDLRLALQRDQLDARPNGLGCCRHGRGPAAVAGRPNLALIAGSRPRLAHPSLRGHHLHRRPGLDSARGGRRGQDRRRDGHQEALVRHAAAPAADRARRSLFGIVFTAFDFAVVYVLTQGGPFNSTQVLTTWSFQIGINSGSLGEGAAISLYLFPLLAVVSVAMLFFARRAQVELADDEIGARSSRPTSCWDRPRSCSLSPSTGCS